jgi:AAA domain
MIQYKVGSAGARKWIRALVGGRISSGKTSFAATTPKPMIIGDAAEGGAMTLESMDPRLWWDPKFPPDVRLIENMMELPQFITTLVNKGAVTTNQTLVIDSISIYAARVMRELKAANPGGDGRQRYGELSDALSALVSRVHSLPMHVIWLCHIDDEMQLSVPGKATASLWAYMDYKWMTHVDTSAKKTNFELHTKPFLRASWLGGRSGVDALPSPMIPSFKPIAELLGLAEKPVSLSCPDFMGQSYMDGVSYT